MSNINSDQVKIAEYGQWLPHITERLSHVAEDYRMLAKIAEKGRGLPNVDESL